MIPLLNIALRINSSILHTLDYILYHVQTLYLFTKADIKVIVLPVTCLAAASAPLTSLSCLPHIIFWIWIQTLQLGLSNQTLDPEEDKQNKPYRPLPSGRVSLRTAIILRWILPIVCCVWSASYSTLLLYLGIINCILIIIYDEMGYAAGHWFIRNVLNALGHASLESGACLLAGKDVNVLDPVSFRSVVCSAGIILCTIQAQDFKDAIGDAATCLAAASAPLASLSRLPHVIFWVWLQTLQLDFSNQTLDPEEDKQNKPYRPLPSGRISLRTALILRWILPFVCFAWSASYSMPLLYASIANCIIVVIYDEMGYAAGHWFIRNVLNAAGHASFEMGACFLAGGNVQALDPISYRAILCSAGIILCTIQAQDFKDTIGDAAVGRKTLPIVHPKVARPILLMLMVAWSIGLGIIWRLDLLTASAITMLGTYIGWAFVTERSPKEDKKNLFYYLVGNIFNVFLDS
ncbi:hypothetical protein EW145_g2932 [Phellinidium pouzarii]|uniref:Uncharacterized protein n=1 Tax=Phellinidium pouzarii TaxID=167371 RepID=A0A4S4L991_9AGAM|nr:hypothetical protein EW145_g2932 [Phellinidium pouzarii]